MLAMKSGKYPCAVCCSGVRNNSIQCSQCMLLVHKKYSGIAKRQAADPNYFCRECNGDDRSIDGGTVTEVDVKGTTLDVEATSCYLDNIMCSGGDCDSTIAARCGLGKV